MRNISELLWSILLITVIGVGALLIVVAARTYRKRMRSEAPDEPFTLQELRELRAAGDITQAEYEAMRAAIVARADANGEIQSELESVRESERSQSAPESGDQS
jgi:hypothetical protein